MKLDLLIIAPTDYESLKGKSVLYQYENFREDGFFDNVVSFFPFTKKNLEIFFFSKKFFELMFDNLEKKLLN